MLDQAVKGLTREQMVFFEREGYLIVEDFFSNGDLQRLIDEVQSEIDRRSAELVKKGQLSRDYREFGFERQLAKISEETMDVAMSIWNGQLCGPAFFDMIRHPGLLDVAESLCGPEVIASAVYRLRPKVPHVKMGEVPWHQDAAYMQSFCDSYFVLTVWLPLVDATEENGCMWIIPGMHKENVVHHRHGKETPYLVIPDREIEGRKPICAEVKKGGVLFLHNRTPHASFENKTDLVRYSMDLRFQSAALPTNAAITRLEGELKEDPEKGIPKACYPPEADFLVRSKARPEQVVRDAAEFHRIRREHIHQPAPGRWGSE